MYIQGCTLTRHGEGILDEANADSLSPAIVPAYFCGIPINRQAHWASSDKK